MKKKTLVIDRKKWLRGEGGENSCLLRKSDGKMCCLGFYMKSLGIKNSAILEIPSPSDVTQKLPQEAEWLIDYENSSNEAKTLIYENDYKTSSALKELAREASIRIVFARHNVQVKFKGGRKS